MAHFAQDIKPGRGYSGTAHPVESFNGRQEFYHDARPDYPRELIDWLEGETGAFAGKRVADVGAGTGKLGRHLVHRGADVSFIEPGDDMRSLIHRDGLKALKGSAESTGLPDGSVDLITAAQSFHFFEQAATRREFDRILNPNGHVFLTWYAFATENPFMRDFDATLAKYTKETGNLIEPDFVKTQNLDCFFVSSGFKHWHEYITIPYSESRFLDLTHSFSYVPWSKHAAQIDLEVREVFNCYRENDELPIRFAFNGFLAGGGER
jgi:ubiquinone/menaquinone biosynthesis C-methylase UbiE